MINNLVDWDCLVHYGQPLFLPGNSVLFRQGYQGTGFYYLKDGEIKISIVGYNGDERIIDIVFTGEILGEHGIHHSPYITTAEAIKDSTLYYFPSKNFQDLCLEVPEAVNEINRSLATKIRLLVNIKSILNASVEIQLAYLFYRLYEKTKNTKISLNQTTLSNFLGTSRVTIWKILNQWKMENIILIKDRTIFINDIQKITRKLEHFFG
ncbi:Crp/Fnr family transcriptional regulator [Neobacillus sp. NPDC058068]|uniref:Crp/Fnr family transcriptional regulator n=1 Tax=Neobacillus sp. NPDC058068 TaxID=3346325 RepID=UPI0036D9E058